MNRLTQIIVALCGTSLLVANAWVNPQIASMSRPQVVTMGLTFSPYTCHSSSTSLHMATEDQEKSNSLPFWLDIGTKGGAVFWSLVLFIVPIIGYNVVTGVFGYDEIEAGKWIGVGFTAIAMLAWSSTYLFRVATKDMTYVSMKVAKGIDKASTSPCVGLYFLTYPNFFLLRPNN